jgi:hypothetical protein
MGDCVSCKLRCARVRRLVLALVPIAIVTTTAPAWAGSIWLTPAELPDRPVTGPAWDGLLANAIEPLGVPGLTNAGNRHDVLTFARALVAARLGLEGDGASYRSSATEGIAAVIGTESGVVARDPAVNVQSYVLAADLIDLAAFDPDLERRFREWIARLRFHCFGPHSFWTASEERPNNWGLANTAARLAVALYLRDHGGAPSTACDALDVCNPGKAAAACRDPQAEIDRVALVFRGWLGDRRAYAGFEYRDLSWQADPRAPVGINRLGARIQERDVDGVLPDDQRRSGPFHWPAEKENYVYEALQAAMTIAVLLHRDGYDVWAWQDMALKRAFDWLHAAHFAPSGTEAYPAEDDDEWLPHLVNHYYGTTFPSVVPARHGKNLGWTDWTHAGVASGAAGCVTTCDDGDPCNGYEACVEGACVPGRVTPRCPATTTTTSTTTTTLPFPSGVCGDATGNGVVTLSDALVVLNFSTGIGICDLSVCDVTGDDLVTISDALTVLRYITGVIPGLSCDSVELRLP